jgi:O-antigen/teichoic acid export membrane protein
MILFSEHVLEAWLGPQTYWGRDTGAIATLYALGNLFMILSSLPYYAQVAVGKLRLHVIGAILSIVIYIPVLIVLVNHSGAVGAAAAWASINIFMSGWSVWVTWRIFGKGSVVRWLQSALTPLLAVSLTGAVLRHQAALPETRISALLALGGIAAALLAVGILVSTSTLKARAAS